MLRDYQRHIPVPSVNSVFIAASGDDISEKFRDEYIDENN